MRTTVTILTLILLTSFSGRLSACSSIGQRTVEEEVKHVAAVVVGTILSKQLITLTDSTMLKMFPNDTTMRSSPMSKMTIARYDLLVQDIYKGKITQDTLTIFTGLGGGDCGVRFEIGKKYIVYGENETYFGQVNNDFVFPKANNTFWTYNCLRTTSNFQDEITEIEKFSKKQKLKTANKSTDKGQTAEINKDSLIAEKINIWKIRGKYFRYELLCSRTFKIKINHHIKYKGGCEGNKDTRKSGEWTIQNDTLIITKIFGEQQRWIFVNGCLYNISTSTNNLVGCRSKEQFKISKIKKQKTDNK